MTEPTSNDGAEREASPRSVLAVGLAPAPAIAAAAADAGLALTYVNSVDRAADAIERARPAAVLFDASGLGAGSDLVAVRAMTAQAGIPIIALAHFTGDLDSLGFAEALGGGADDLCPRRRDPVARRLRAIARAHGAGITEKTGRAVVIDRERASRVLTGCALRNAGYDVVFAESGEEGLAMSLEGETRLVTWRLGSCDDLGAGSPPPAFARESGSLVPWVIGASPKDIAETRRRIAGVGGISVYDAFGPPVDVLFVANELLNGDCAESRASARVLYGAVVHIRPAGGEHDELGYVYNVSAGGFYVRTLAPPERGADIWLELPPPRTARRVRLEAVVVWTRSFGANDRATVPPGFGARITGGSRGDLERYEQGCEAFAAALR